MNITDKLLAAGEYYAQITRKDKIFIHHTAGGSRPDWSIDGWAHDRNKAGGQLPVATAYVIGGLSTSNLADTAWDGKIIRAFDDKFWAHHLGTHLGNNVALNESSVAIEICNYGPLTKTPDGRFLTYVNTQVPAEHVCTLDRPFKGHIYYHRYTDKQIEALRLLVIDIATRHGINLKKGLQECVHVAAKEVADPNYMAFGLNGSACHGDPGLWTHVNVLAEKFDCYPDPRLIAMINSL